MASVEKPAPWWLSLLPDMRGWAALGFFALAFMLLLMVRENPKLLANASFMQLAGMIVTGGVLLVGSNLFGGTKSGTETTAKALDALSTSTPADPGK